MPIGLHMGMRARDLEVKLMKLVKLAKVVAFVMRLFGSRLWKRSRGLIGELADWTALA